MIEGERFGFGRLIVLQCFVTLFNLGYETVKVFQKKVTS